MGKDQIEILVAMIIYMLFVIGIGIFFAKRANKNTENFFLGGRSLGPWVTAMSAEASDMSGWLLMGLPGVAYWLGLADAFWTALGLAIGTYLNWLLLAKRLRGYSVVANNSITLPDFFSNRFKETKKILLGISALFILVFFTVYASSCFITCGKLFATLFGMEYKAMVLVGALFVIIYTFLGGFLAESASDFMQAIVMIIALGAILICGVTFAGGVNAVVDNVRQFPGFLEFFGIAQPQTVDSVQQVVNGAPVFGAAGAYPFLTILSTMAWGLGYFGMPQVLLRFMAIRKIGELKRSRRIAVVWVVISLFSAVLIGIIGRAIYPAALLTSSTSENVFILMSTKLLPPLLAGFAMAGILAATISSSDSYLLIAASSFSMNLFKGIFKKDATDKQTMAISRITLLSIALIGVILAMGENQIIFQVVSFAWAGFGATFGPIMIFSLFWKRTTYAGAVAGMVSGGAMVFIWKLLIRGLGGIFGIYELLPAFIFSCIMIVVVSLLTKKPSEEILSEFEAAKDYKAIA